MTEENAIVTDEDEGVETAAVASTVHSAPAATKTPRRRKRKSSKVSPERAAADTKKAAVEKQGTSEEREFESVSGYRIKLVPVAANTLREAQTRIPDPPMRTFTNPNTGKEQENPAHPEYIAELNAVTEERTKATFNAMQLFGVELLDPIPSDNGWLKKCLFLGLVTQEEYDEATGDEGEFLRELFFKNYIVSDFAVLRKLAEMSGITEEKIAEARKSFPGDS